MTDWTVIWDWLTFLLRWAHVATAIAWFGAAFYFRARELRLRACAELPEGAIGAEWEFHGGGYFRAIKYAVPPPGAPERLGMFKWESYFTWLTGALLLAVIYYAEARLFLIDEGKIALSPAVAITISVLSLLGGWLIYDQICKRMIDLPARWLDVLVFLLMITAAWGYDRVFTGRAAMLHLGALLATIMIGNVFFVVVRNGNRAMAALRSGARPDPADRRRTAQRGRHTRFLHLPVIFLMASVHAPVVFGTQYAWTLAPIVVGIGTMIGMGFESWHRRRVMPLWPWAGSAVLAVLMMWITATGRPVLPAAAHGTTRLTDSPHFAAVTDVVSGRCAMCHAAEPAWEGVTQPARQVLLDTPEHLAESARQIYLQAGVSTAMPPGNVTFMTDEERGLIVQWYREAR